MTAALANVRRRGIAPPGVWVYVGTPPKWVAETPDWIVACSNPRTSDRSHVVVLMVHMKRSTSSASTFGAKQHGGDPPVSA